MSKHTKLAIPERVLISERKKQGLCGNEIAKKLGRDRSTIGRELKRNQIKVKVGKKRGLYLDIGSGDGVLTAEILLRNPGIRVVCGDIPRNFLEQTRDRLAQIPEARGRYALYQMDAGQQFPFEDGIFVGSLAHFVATYFDREEQMMLYKEVVRVSEDGAVCTMNTLLKPFKEVVGGMIRKEAPTNPKGVQRFMRNIPIAQ